MDFSDESIYVRRLTASNQYSPMLEGLETDAGFLTTTSEEILKIRKLLYCKDMAYTTFVVLNT